MKKVELLAPAGSLESMHAAVQSGANAVYLGGSKFSARAYASNFDDENMEKTIKYCHLYGIKVYITLNTLIKENELEEAIKYVEFLYKIGIDGLLVQDIGLAHIIGRNFSGLDIHASTQMTIHNKEGALFLNKIGFKRVVLSRELSLKEIENISKELDIETEIFMHGALCICYSGQCLMSSLIGGRSGNRGRCAQPCRLPYTVIDKGRNKEKSLYALSPKDICTLEDIKQIVESGTDSLKIEGRMKRPEYVAGVVDTYRKAIDAVEQKKPIEVNGKSKLLKLFNREGFSKAYLFGNVGKKMMAYNFPKNTGVVLGKVMKDSTIILEEDVALRDGIRIGMGEDGFTISKIIKNKEEVQDGLKGDRVKIFPVNYKSGDVLYKTSDTKLLEELSKSYINPYNRKIELPLEVKFSTGSPISITTFYDNNNFSADGDIVEVPIKKPLDKEKLEENLKKAGDTPFKFNNINFLQFENGFLPLSSINSVRRKLIEDIEKYIENKYRRNFNKDIDLTYTAKLNNKGDLNIKKALNSLVCVSTNEQFKAAQDFGMENICVNLFNKANDIDIEGKNVYLKIPNIIKQEFEEVCELIEKKLPIIKGIVTGNLGIINRFQDRTKIIGDYKLNLFNSYALNFYEEFIDLSCLSVELNKREIESIAKVWKKEFQLLIYGKIELMVSEYCPIGSVFGEKDDKASCNGMCIKCAEDKGNCGKSEFFLRDRKGEEFLIKTDKFCRSYIYNSVPINLLPDMEELNKLKTSSYRLDFIDENYEEVIRILTALCEGRWTEEYKNYTRGHYKRGVE